MKSQNKPLSVKRKTLPTIVLAGFHGLGILLIAIILFVPFVTQDIISLYFEALANPTFANSTFKDILFHLGLATCVWTLGNILFRLWDLKRNEKPKLVRATRGSVMVETLIILIPFLLLTSGIAQLTILNISGVLAHLASFQATRTAWVWQPEANKSRKGADSTMVQRRARLAAAAVMAPAAPSDFEIDDNSDTELNDLRGAMTGAFTTQFSITSGTEGRDQVNTHIQAGKAATDKNMEFKSAFDRSSFTKRAARKLTLAYAATTLNVSASSDTITTRLQYKQNIVFPWFAYIWGSLETVGGRNGYYVTLDYEFSMPAQVDL